MAILFRDLAEDERLGLAGYLRFVEESDGRGIQGALFFMNAAGHPVDFSFCRIDLPSTFLWRPGQAREQAVIALTKSLFGASRKEPVLLLTLAEEVSPRIFSEDLDVLVPLCRVAVNERGVHLSGESLESLDDAIQLWWVKDVPVLQSPARRLLEKLHLRGLVTEPFDRAAIGIEEAFKQS